MKLNIAKNDKCSVYNIYNVQVLVSGAGRGRGIIGATAVHGHTAGIDRQILDIQIDRQILDRQIDKQIQKDR